MDQKQNQKDTQPFTKSKSIESLQSFVTGEFKTPRAKSEQPGLDDFFDAMTDFYDDYQNQKAFIEEKKIFEKIKKKPKETKEEKKLVSINDGEWEIKTYKK